MKYFEIYEDKNLNILNLIPNIEDLKKLDKIFKKEGFQLRIVGGVVRDLLQNIKPKDVDLATTATPFQMVDLAKKYKIRYIPTGLRHGTVTFVINDEGYEITTLRIDKETDGRHADIEFTTDWHKDAERRDLTFNAISMDFDGNVFDYYGGIEDLKSGKSKFVGRAEKRIQEDYLRILRYFRFQGRVSNSSWDQETLNAIKDNVNGLSKISGERIWMELSKILTGKHVSSILRYMDKTGVLNLISIPNKHLLNVNQIKKYTNNPIVILSSLLNNINEVENINNRYKLSANERDLLDYIVRNKNNNFDEQQILRLILNKKAKKEDIVNLLLVQNKKDLSDKIKNMKIPTFPLTGSDLIDKGIKPGPQMGKILMDLKSKWIKSRFKLDKNELLKLI